MGSIRPFAVVTGASAGIGRAFAAALASEGYDLLIVARRRPLLEELAASLAAHGGSVHVAAEDLTAPGAALRVLKRARDIGTCELLINNAGAGMVGSLVEHDPDKLAAMLGLNVVAATSMMRAFLSEMLPLKRGVVLNVASTAAFQPVPHFAPYAASKAYLLSLSEAVAEEVRGTGVRVIAVCPGATESEFASSAGMDPSMFGAAYMSAESVVRIALEKGIHGTQGVVVPGLINNLTAVGVKVLPREAVKRVAGWIYRRIGKESRKP